MITIPLDNIVLFFAFSLKYPNNVIVKGIIREMAMLPKTCMSIISPSLVAMYKALTEILKITEEQMKIVSINLFIFGFQSLFR